MSEIHVGQSARIPKNGRIEAVNANPNIPSVTYPVTTGTTIERPAAFAPLRGADAEPTNRQLRIDGVLHTLPLGTVTVVFVPDEEVEGAA